LPLLELEKITKYFVNGQVRTDVLKGISLEVGRGEYMSIMGPSGSGKSTLLNIIGCLDRPSAGNYAFDSRPINRLSDNSLADLRNAVFGFVFQRFHLLPNLDALANIELPLIYRGLSKRKRTRAAKEALTLVGLEDRQHHRPNQLSGGEQQRVAIARAIVGKPQILFADEPTGALDSKNSINIMQVFSRLNQEMGLTILQVTHDINVSHFGRRTLFMQDGIIEREEVVTEEQRRIL